jgi:SPP1 gp7 family putative phage head morphogenesis protein
MRFDQGASCAACGGLSTALQTAAEVRAFDTKPVEAVDFLRRKLNVPTDRWTDLWQQMHSFAFTVAGASTDSLVSDFHDAVDEAIEEGLTLDDFRRSFDRIVEEHGWSYNGSRNWRSRIIFETNLRTAYAAGRWEQIQQVKEQRPYIRYVAVMDQKTRPEHASWHDTVLPADDPWWQTHFPPNGWNCRCTVQSLNERDLARYGLSVSDRAPVIEWEERTINASEGPRTILVPAGIDPGFAYRPGEQPDQVVKDQLLNRATPRNNM